MNGVLQFLWSASIYISVIGLLFILIRWLMNKLNCLQTSIYQLWFIFPLGLVFMLFLQMTNYTIVAPLQISNIVLPEISVTAQYPIKHNTYSLFPLFAWMLIVTALLIRLYIQYFKFKQSLNMNINTIDKNTYESPFIMNPMAFGIIKACIYLPMNSKYNHCSSQKSLLIEHEFYHCKRHDPLVRMIYKILVIIFWFHPIIYMINKMMKYDQESSVDQLVLNNPKNQSKRIEYSKLLVHVSQITNRELNQLPELYCSSNSMLKERIMLIKNNKTKRTNLMNKMLTGVFIIPALATIIITSSSLAHTSDTNHQNKTDNIKQIPTPPKAPKAPKAIKSKITQVQGTDIKIIPIERHAPYYPRKAVTEKISGFVTMDVDIAPNGSVNDVRVVESEPDGVFEVEAIRSVKKYKFAPVAQTVTIQQTVDFKLD